MNSVEKSLIAGFGNDVEDYIVYAKQGDTERKLKIQLVDELTSYVIQDVGHIFFKEKFSNDIILPPIDILEKAEISEDGSEITMQLTSEMLAVSGVAKCELAFCTCASTPEITEDGKIIADDLRILSTKHFSIYIDGTVYDGGQLSPIDTQTLDTLTPLLILVQDIADRDAEYQANEAVRIANEDARIEAESDRVIAENGRVEAETDRDDAETQRDEKETNRQTKESDRVLNEQYRQEHERERAEADTLRDSNELARQTAETIRETQETQRQEDTAAAIARANAISADLEEKVATNYYAGKDFHIATTYPTIAAMEADYDNPDVAIGDFVCISSDVEDPDNAKMYAKTSVGFSFITDLSGMRGYQGNSGELEIGTVTTLPYGSSATVENVGTKTHAIFNIGLPQGPPGDSGLLPDIPNHVAGVVLPDDETIKMRQDGTIYTPFDGRAYYADADGYISFDYDYLREVT